MLLLMAQVDDVPGELIGEFIQRAVDIGAKNVQVVPSITKKNRPGFIVYVDVAESLENDIAALFGAELGTWGYRIIAAEHKHFEIERFDVQVKICISEIERVFELRAKRISQAGVFTRVKAEYDDISKICRSMREHNQSIAVGELKAAVESALKNDKQATEIAVSF